MSNDINISVGDAVMVKRDVYDPDIDDWNADDEWWGRVSLEGWVGIVTEIYGNESPITVMLEWDCLTMDRAPHRWYAFCEEHTEYEFGYMRLTVDDVIPAEPRDSAEERLALRQKICADFEWKERYEELQEAAAVSLDADDQGEVTWSTRMLRAPLMAQALHGYVENEGLDALKEASRTHHLKFHEGSIYEDGKLGPLGNTAKTMAELRKQGLGTMIVIAEWDDLSLFGEDVRVQKEVVVSLSPRMKPDDTPRRRMRYL